MDDSSENIIKNAQNTFHNLAGIMSSPVIRIAEQIKDRLHEPVELIEYYREKNLPLLQNMLENWELRGSSTAVWSVWCIQSARR